MSTELATVDGEIIDRAPITLFGTDDPAAVLARASTVATALAGVIGERKLFKRIRDRDHIYVEGWTLLGSMLGVFASVEWTRPVENGWEARVVARTMSGAEVGAAEAMCTRAESTWQNREDHALRSMAQTRAVSKALRMPLGFIIELAGYSATPAEELPDEQPARGERRGSVEAAPPATPSSAQYRRGELAELMAAKNLDLSSVETYAALLGIPKDERPMSNESMDRLIEAIEGHGSEEEIVLPNDSAAPAVEEPAGGVPPVASEPALPPKPKTEAYAALPPAEKAEARAYWAEQERDAKHKDIQPEPAVLGLDA